MKLTPWMLTVASFGLIAVLAVGFIFKKLTAEVEVPAPRVETRTLPMAITDIEAGTLITRAHVGNGPWRPDASLEPDTFTSVDGVVGRIARERITAAQPLRGSQFYAPGEFPDLDVSPGMRAVSVNVGNDTAMVSRLIKPGQYVDVHLTVSRPGSAVGGTSSSAEESVTVTLFEGVRVIAIDRSTTTAGRGDAPNVTLELNREQARMMLLGAERGKVALTFNPEGAAADHTAVEGDDHLVTLNEVLGLPEPQPPEQPFRSENYRGGDNTNLYFRDGELMDGGGSVDAGGGNGGGTPIHRRSGSADWLSDRTPADDAVTPSDRTAVRRN